MVRRVRKLVALVVVVVVVFRFTHGPNVSPRHSKREVQDQRLAICDHERVALEPRSCNAHLESRTMNVHDRLRSIWEMVLNTTLCFRSGTYHD